MRQSFDTFGRKDGIENANLNRIESCKLTQEKLEAEAVKNYYKEVPETEEHIVASYLDNPDPIDQAEKFKLPEIFPNLKDIRATKAEKSKMEAKFHSKGKRKKRPDQN